MNNLEKELEKYKKENNELKLRNSKIKNTISFRLGNILVTGTRSYRDFFKIPYELLKLRRDVRNFKKNINKASLPINEKKVILSQHEYFILREKPVSGFIIADSSSMTLTGEIKALTEEKPNAAILTFEIAEQHSTKDLATSLGLSWSKKVGMYCYLPTNKGTTKFSVSLTNLPKGRINIAARRWYSQGQVKISGSFSVNEIYSDSSGLINNLNEEAVSILLNNRGFDALENEIDKAIILSDEDRGTLLSAIIKNYNVQDRKSITKAVDLLLKKPNIKRNDIEAVCQHLYKEGCYKEALKIYEKVSYGLTSLQHNYIKDIIFILENSFDIPLQTSIFTLPLSNDIRYYIHCSLPHHSNGYATRSHSVLTTLKEHGLDVIGATRPGYPWDVRFDKKPKDQTGYFIDDIKYEHLPGLIQRDMTISDYINKASQLIESDIKKNGAKIIHACSNYLNAFPALIAARRLGLPFVYEVRGFWEITEASRKLGWLDSDKFAIDKKMESLLIENSDAVITLTESMKNEIVNRGAVQEKIFVAPNAVSIDKFNPTEKDISLQDKIGLNDNITIGYVGSIVDYEGLDDLISASYQLLNAGYKFNVLIVGDGAALNNLKYQVRNLGIEKHVFFTGRVPHDDIVKYYSLIDIAPFPRKALEVCELVSPLKPFEAMALRKCVIASDVKAIKEFITDGENGFLFKKNDINSLRDTLAKLIDNPALRNSVMAKSRVWVSSNRTWIKSGEIFSQVYRSLPSLIKINNAKKSKSNVKLKVVDSENLSNKSDIINLQHTVELDSSNPLWFSMSVKAGQKLIVEAAIDYQTLDKANSRKAVILFKCFDSKGNLTDTPCGKVTKSVNLHAYFKYLPCTAGIPKLIHTFSVPTGIEVIHVGLRGFNITKGDKVYLNSLSIRPKSQIPQLLEFNAPSALAAALSIHGWPELPSNSKPRILGIMDEFTAGCFEQDINLIQARPDNWYALAEKYNPELIFIESAWKGNFGSWQYRVAEYKNKPGNEVAYLCDYAKKKGIPTLFWNKEDPVHHDKFMGTAKLVDHIFTTDINMTDSYRSNTGNDNVYALPFAAQPALHKPASLTGRKQLICFAGSWYGGRHAAREEAMQWLLQAAKPYGLEIYDRNYGTDIFPFPEKYQNCIKGSLPYKELCSEYNRYRVFLNVNSVIDSPTMFSRRVFELMASGTPIVSTYSAGIENLFDSDAVWLVNTKEEAEEAIRTLMTDDSEWRRRSLAGIREVFKKHTYAHRLNQIFEQIGSKTKIITEPNIILTANARTLNDINHYIDFCNRQEYRNFKLGIECLDRKTKIPKIPYENITFLKRGGSRVWFEKNKSNYSIAGLISPLSHYGKYYLRDLVNASIYEPEAIGWAKSSDRDYFSYGATTKQDAALWKISEYFKLPPTKQSIGDIAHSKVYLTDCAEYLHINNVKG